MKPKTISGILAAAIILMPVTQRAQQQPPPNPKFEFLMECAGAGTILIVGTFVLLRICSSQWRWPGDPSMTSPPLPGFPTPVQKPPPVDEDSIGHLTITGPVASIPLTAGSLLDTNGPALVAFTNYSQFSLQSGTRLDGFVDLYRFCVWESPSGALVQVNDSADRPQWTSYSARAGGKTTNSIPLFIGTGHESQKWFRLLSK